MELLFAQEKRKMLRGGEEPERIQVSKPWKKGPDREVHKKNKTGDVEIEESKDEMG